MKRLMALMVLAGASVACGRPNDLFSDEPAAQGVNPKATFALSKELFHGEPKVGWDGFLSGLRGFEHFYEPVGNPIYFESPFNTSGLRFLYLHHDFPKGSQLQGGDLSVYALQIRLAITERLAFIATKDGYSELDATALPKDNGWNDLAFGGKYLFYVDRESDLVAAAGVRWQIKSGDEEVLQGDVGELSPFVSVAKGWDKFHLIGNLTYRLPLDGDDGNDILQWDIHADYEIAPETLPGFAPLVELHGLHYLSNGTRTPLWVGGADYTNLGSTDVAGSAVIWLGVGARWKLSPNASIGATYEFPLTDPDKDIFDQRVTVDFQLTW